MKILIYVFSLYLSFFIFVNVYAESKNVLINSLKPWQPKSVSMDGNRLVIVLNENKITNAIFEAIITSGVCTPIWLGEKTNIYHAEEIVILNQFGRQGFIFEKPVSTCSKMGKLPDKGASEILSGNSRLY